MIVNLRDICAIAEQNNMAIASINVPSLEALRAALDAAEETGYPVILSHAEGHEPFAPLDALGPSIVALAERSSAMVCVHLDHCEHLSYMRRALEMGFTGAMFDGSLLPYEENVENSQRAADMVSGFDCGLECELGSMGQAEDFISKTGLDILACSFGTSHGIYKGEPHLSFDVLTQIRDRVKVPLVMHGGSGVSDDDYRRSIDAGIRKINYYTYGVKYAGDAVRKVIADYEAKNPGEAIVYWHDMTQAAYETLFQDFKHVIQVFANGAASLA